MNACPHCKYLVAEGTRWCTICRSSVADEEIGRLASPARRLAASCIDFLVPIVVVLINIFLKALVPGGSGESIVALALLLAFGIWSLLLFVRGTTPGKMVLGLRVVREDGSNARFFTMLLREWIGKWVSGVALFFGFAWILIDGDHQGWHDKLAGTYVVQRHGDSTESPWEGQSAARRDGEPRQEEVRPPASKQSPDNRDERRSS